MEKKSQLTTRAAFDGAQLAWGKTETVTVQDLEGNPITITVRAGMPLADLFEAVVEAARIMVTDAPYMALYGDMIMAQVILEVMTDLPVLNNMEQMEIDQCYELVFGYDGIVNQLDPDGPASFLIRKLRGYTSDLAERIMADPTAFELDDEDDDMADLFDLDDLRNIRKN